MSDFALRDYDAEQSIVMRFLHFLTSFANFGVQHPREFLLSEQLWQVPFIQAQAKEYPVADAFERLCIEAKDQRLLKDLPDTVMPRLVFGALSTLVEAHVARQIQLNDALIEQVVWACWDAIKR
jgi:hypothetical protein